MRMDKYDTDRYRRQSKNSGDKEPNSRRWLPLLSVLAVAAILLGAWRIGLFDSSPGDSTIQQASEADTAPPTSANQAKSAPRDASRISVSINELNDKIDFLVGANQRDNSQFKKVNEELQKIRNGLGGLEDSIGVLQRRIATLESRSSQLASNIENLDSRMQAEIIKFNETNAEETEALEKINNDIQNLDALSRSQAQSVEQVENYLNNINTRVTNLER